MSRFSSNKTWHLSGDVPAGEGFLCDKVSMLGDTIKGTCSVFTFWEAYLFVMMDGIIYLS